MCKFLGIAVALAVYIGTINTVDAATKCVALDKNYLVGCFNGSANTNETDWSATCPLGDKETRVRGIAMCSSTAATYGSAATTLAQSSNDDENINCWCKLVAPAESKWIASITINSTSLSGPATPSECRTRCASACAIDIEKTGNSGWFHQSMFSNLI